MHICGHMMIYLCFVVALYNQCSWDISVHGHMMWLYVAINVVGIYLQYDVHVPM